MKRVLTFTLLVALGVALSFWFFSNRKQTEVNVDGDVIIEKIKAVRKIIVTEGYFSEVYNYKEADKYFYNLISFEKKALLMVKGKVQINYNLELMEYDLDETTKTIHITKLPEPEMSVEPTIKYYDLQESTFNSFSEADYNKLNEQAIKKLKDEVNKSGLIKTAEKSLENALQEMQWIGKEMGWKVLLKSKT